MPQTSTRQPKNRVPLPTRAVILAAGHGTRLDPLTRELPKALVPFRGEALLERALRQAASWGVRDVLVNCHAHAGQVVRALTSRPGATPRIHISYEPEILGTGGALSCASWFVGGDTRPFWMLNADVVAELDPANLARKGLRGRTIATLWMEPLRGPRTVEMRSGTISNFRSDHPGAGGTYTFCGLQLLSPKILSYIPNGFSTIIEAYEAAMADGWRVAGHEIPGSYWADVGNAEQYLDANREVAARQKGSRADGTQIDPGADVHGKAKLHNAVVLQNASVGARARCCNVIVGPGTRVNTECSGLVTRAAATCTTAERKALERLGLRPDRACIEKNHRSGSDRAFYRVTDGATSVILVRYGLEREENDLYADHAVLLRRAGVRVPRLHAADRRNRFLVMEDAGRHSVEDLFPGWPEPDAARVYHEVIEQVFQFHRGAARLARAGRVRLMPRFDDSLCRWEHGWFETHFLRPRGVPRRTCKAVLHELRTLSRGLCGGRASLLHRDLQSSNILVQRGRPVFIDFQGMRLGPAAYDIASLICDPYVMLSLDTQEELTEHYRSFDRAAARSMQWIWPAAVQRLSQALGAYGRLGTLPGGQRFQGYIPPACSMMRRVAKRCEKPTNTLLEALRIALARESGGSQPR